MIDHVSTYRMDDGNRSKNNNKKFESKKQLPAIVNQQVSVNSATNLSTNSSHSVNFDTQSFINSRQNSARQKELRDEININNNDDQEFDDNYQSNDHLPELHFEKSFNSNRKQSISMSSIDLNDVNNHKSYTGLSSRMESPKKSSTTPSVSRYMTTKSGSRTLSQNNRLLQQRLKRSSTLRPNRSSENRSPTLEEYFQLDKITKHRTFCVTDGLSLDAQCSIVKVYEDYIKSELKTIFPNFSDEIPSTPLSLFTRPNRYSDVSLIDRSSKVCQITASAMIILDNIEMIRSKASEEQDQEHQIEMNNYHLMEIFSKWIRYWNKELLCI
jgi:hypothetical protein